MPGGRQSVEGKGAVEAALVVVRMKSNEDQKVIALGGGFLRDDGDGIPSAVVGLLRIR